MLDRKGQIRILEALLAVSIIFSVLALTSPLSSTPNLDRQAMLKKLGTHVLIELDKDGTLGEFIEDRNWTALERAVEIFLPLGALFNLTVYDEQMLEVNTQRVSNSNLSGMQGFGTISVQYLCVTRGSDVRFYRVRLQLAWAE